MANVLDASIGIKKETTFGTAVTVDRFPEFIGESLGYQDSYVQSAGRRVGSRMGRSAGRVLAKKAAGGSVQLEAVTKGLGLWLNAALGGTPTVTETADTGVYQQVHTPSTSGPKESYTLQKGVVPVGGGSVQAYTFPGSVCESLELDFTSDILKITTEWMSREVITSEAYAAPSYVVGAEPLAFIHGEIVIGGTFTKPTTTALASSSASAAVDIKGGTISIKNNLDGDGYNMGGAGKRRRTSENGELTVTGNLQVELTDTTLRNALLNQTRMALLLTFTHPTTIGASSHPVLQVAIPVIVFNSDIPQDNQGKPIVTSMAFEAKDGLASGTAPIYFVYVSTDSAI